MWYSKLGASSVRKWILRKSGWCSEKINEKKEKERTWRNKNVFPMSLCCKFVVSKFSISIIHFRHLNWVVFLIYEHKLNSGMANAWRVTCAIFIELIILNGCSTENQFYELIICRRKNHLVALLMNSFDAWLQNRNIYFANLPSAFNLIYKLYDFSRMFLFYSMGPYFCMLYSSQFHWNLLILEHSNIQPLFAC